MGSRSDQRSFRRALHLDYWAKKYRRGFIDMDHSTSRGLLVALLMTAVDAAQKETSDADEKYFADSGFSYSDGHFGRSASR
jgi:hypothetical protein